jgi:hypothetical protein
MRRQKRRKEIVREGCEDEIECKLFDFVFELI